MLVKKPIQYILFVKIEIGKARRCGEQFQYQAEPSRKFALHGEREMVADSKRGDRGRWCSREQICVIFGNIISDPGTIEVFCEMYIR